MLVTQTRKLYEAASFLREHAWLGYAFAVLTSAVAMYVRVLLSGVLQGFPFITFFVAIVLTAFIFRWRAGTLCAVLGGVIAGYFMLPADWSLTSYYGASNWIGMGFYVVLTGVILLLTAAMHRGFAEYADDVEAKKYFERDPAKSAKAVDHAMEGAPRAAELTARLLAFSRQQPLDPKPVDVNKLVGSMSEMLTRTLGGNIRMETVLAGGLWRMFADPPQLETGYTRNAVIHNGMLDRDVSFLPKPFTLQQLATKVRQVLDQR